MLPKIHYISIPFISADAETAMVKRTTRTGSLAPVWVAAGTYTFKDRPVEGFRVVSWI
jgi:hypothetical protein